MAKTINKLTDSKVRKIGPGLHPDGDGLYLQVRGESSRSWVYRYMHNGRGREMGLGPYPAISLEGARRERDMASMKAIAITHFGMNFAMRYRTRPLVHLLQTPGLAL